MKTKNLFPWPFRNGEAGSTFVLVLGLCHLFVHGFGFIDAMIYNMFTPLLIFVLRFHWLLQTQPALEAKRERSLS